MIIGISGPTASGKTLFANTIMNEISNKHVVIIAQDAYYKDQPNLSPEEKSQINYDHPDSMDNHLLHQHLIQLKQGQTVEVPIYDYALHCRSQQTRPLHQHKIIILEGILLFVDPALRALMDIRIFIDTPLDICLIRRLRRDLNERGRSLDSILTQYEKTVRPMYFQFIEPYKRYADIIVPRGGENRIAIDMIKAKMRELLNLEMPS